MHEIHKPDNSPNEEREVEGTAACPIPYLPQPAVESSNMTSYRHNRDLSDNNDQSLVPDHVSSIESHTSLRQLVVSRTASFLSVTTRLVMTLFISLSNRLHRSFKILQTRGGPALATAWNLVSAGFRLVRTAVAISTTALYIIEVSRNALRHCSLVTYSDNFEGDLVSYLFQNSPAMLQRHREIKASDGRVLDLIQMEAGGLPLIERVFPIRLATKSVYNTLSSLLVTNCTADNSTTQCTLTRSGLVFKFSDAISKNVPSLAASTRTWPLVTTTISIYLLYTIIGMLVSMTVTAFCMQNLVIRLLRYSAFVKRLGLIIANSVSAIA